MTTLHRRRAAGFTLIELLVVISILAVLSAIGVGAYFRVRGSSQLKANEDTVAKIETGLQQLWSAELNSAQDSYKGTGSTSGYSAKVDTVKLIAGGDSDRAKALWYYLWMKNAFPQNFAEATANTTITDGTNSTFLPPRFSGLTGVADTRDQAAVLLYRILTTKGSRGQVFSEESTGALSAPLASATNYRVFTDTNASPLIYIRFATNGEINASPFTKPGVTSNDPFDPGNRLRTLTGSYTSTVRTQVVQSLLDSTISDFPGTNFLPTVVSRGAIPTWTGLTIPATTPIGTITLSDAAGFTCGYKLRRQGNRGDQ